MGRAVDDDEPVRTAPAGLSRVVEELAGTTGGVAPVNRLLFGMCCSTAEDADGEVATTVVAELARRYLRAVRSHAAGAPVARSWQVLLDEPRAAPPSPLRTTLAGVHALAGHDLAPAVVSACTLLGRAPGPAERDVTDRISAALADAVHQAARTGGDRDPEAAAAARGLALLLGRRDAWRHAELLWALRGRPAEAEAERAAFDWRTSVVGQGLLGDVARVREE
jgi:Family of unknown function (DUF5995)